ncbi:MAG: nucleotidyltransferase domain-containing protein [Thermodesulfobacteriota bacterium]
MSLQYGLKKETLKKIREVFGRYGQVEEVIIYGSRAKGNYRPGSDIDLTLKGRELDLKTLNRISLDLDDLLLPYTFDLSVFSHISNPEFLDHIERVGQVFYCR